MVGAPLRRPIELGRHTTTAVAGIARHGPGRPGQPATHVQDAAAGSSARHEVRRLHLAILPLPAPEDGRSNNTEHRVGRHYRIEDAAFTKSQPGDKQGN